MDSSKYCLLDHRALDCGRATVLTASKRTQITRAEGSGGAIDCCRVISDAVSNSTKVFDVPEELVARVRQRHLQVVLM